MSTGNLQRFGVECLYYWQIKSGRWLGRMYHDVGESMLTGNLVSDIEHNKLGVLR